METDYLGKRFRILPARPFQFAPRNSVSITRYGNNIYKGVIDWSLNACCKLKLVFWKSIFKITWHRLPCFSFCFFNSILKWRGFIIIKKKVSHACTRTSLVNKLDKYGETIAIVYVVWFIFLCPIRGQHLLDPLEMVWWELIPRGSSAHAALCLKPFITPFLPTRLISPGSLKMLRHLIALQIDK